MDSDERAFATKNARHSFAMVIFTAITAAAAVGGGIYAAIESREASTLSRATFQESKQARIDQQKQVEMMLAESVKDREAVQQQYDERKKYDVQRQTEENLKEEQREREKRKPRLVQYKCCRPVAIVAEPRPFGRRRVGVVQDNKFKYFPDHYNFGHLVTVANKSNGTAFNARAKWHPEIVKTAEGREFPIAPSDNLGYQTEPIQIGPDEEALIKDLPAECLFDDHSVFTDGIASVTGYLELTCFDKADDRHSFNYNFTMTFAPYERQFSNNWTLYSLHIELDDEERDKPSLDPGPKPDEATTLPAETASTSE